MNRRHFLCYVLRLVKNVHEYPNEKVKTEEICESPKNVLVRLGYTLNGYKQKR